MMPEAPALERRSRLVSFGPFAFDAQNRLLSRDGTEIPLPPRVLGVLELLLDRPGEVVSRQDLLDSVWKDAFVTDTSLAEAVSFLRQALGDDPQAPRYVQTVHRRGYRFLPPVRQPAPFDVVRGTSRSGRTAQAVDRQGPCAVEHHGGMHADRADGPVADGRGGRRRRRPRSCASRSRRHRERSSIAARPRSPSRGRPDARVVGVRTRAEEVRAVRAPARSPRCRAAEGHRRSPGAVLFARRTMDRVFRGRQAEEDRHVGRIAGHACRRARAGGRLLGIRRPHRVRGHARGWTLADIGSGRRCRHLDHTSRRSRRGPSPLALVASRRARHRLHGRHVSSARRIGPAGAPAAPRRPVARAAQRRHARGADGLRAICSSRLAAISRRRRSTNGRPRSPGATDSVADGIATASGIAEFAAADGNALVTVTASLVATARRMV